MLPYLAENICACVCVCVLVISAGICTSANDDLCKPNIQVVDQFFCHPA